MRTLLKSLIAGFLALIIAAPAAFAQQRPPFSQAELDQMLAPIALYPDSLLSQILMASTYPVEVVQAARWSRANAHLRGDDAVRAVEPMDWDPSVKSLVAFPQILDRMDERIDWTEDLGEAFLAQEPDVMESIQHLRRRAAAAGHLGPNEHMRVIRHGDYIVIEPVRPQIVYVPYYNPVVVYGTWWWPAYPPVRWAPWPGYTVRIAQAPGYYWGSGVTIRIGFFFGHFDWPKRHVTVVHRHPPKVVVHEHTTIIRRPPPRAPVRWQHDPRHRRDAPYRVTRPREPHAAPLAPRADRRRDDDRRDAGRPAKPPPRIEQRRERAAPPNAPPAQAPDRRGRFEERRERAAAAPAARSVSAPRAEGADARRSEPARRLAPASPRAERAAAAQGRGFSAPRAEGANNRRSEPARRPAQASPAARAAENRQGREQRERPQRRGAAGP